MLNKNQIRGIFLSVILLSGCRPICEQCNENHALSEQEWGSYGYDLPNQSTAPTGSTYSLSLVNQFMSEAGDSAAAFQTLISEKITVPNTESGCNNCTAYFIRGSIDFTYSGEAVKIHTPMTTIYTGAGKTWITDVEINGVKKSVGVQDSITNMLIKGQNYPKAYHFVMDSAMYYPGLQTREFYFAPGKGVVKILYTQNHFWERTN